MNKLDTWKAEQLPLLEQKLNYTFKNKTWIERAFTHRSFLNENKEVSSDHNERLEFLGDSILNFIISSYLFTLLPSMQEGELSHLRSQIIDAKSCAFFIKKLSIAPFLLLSRGEIHSFGNGKESILGDLFEAILAAIYLDGGMQAAEQFIFTHFPQEICAIIQNPSKNWKAELQDYAQKRFQQPPIYRVIKEEGPDHEKTFHIEVFVEQKKLGKGKANSKKKAQQLAAKEALERISKEEDD